MLSAKRQNVCHAAAGAGKGEVDAGLAAPAWRRAARSRYFLNTVGAGLALLGLLSAAPARAEPLRAALARAYTSNPALNAERGRQRADDEAVPQARSLGRPRVGLSLAAGLQNERETPSRRERREAIAEALAAAGSDPAARQAALLEARRATRPQVTAGPGLDLGLDASQTLFNGGLTAASVGSAESQVLAGRETLRGVEQDVLLGAAAAYLDVVQAQANVALRRANVVFLDEVLRQARKRYESGETALTDQAQAESRRARGGADLAQAEANLVTARAVYRAAVGAEPGGLPSSYASEATFQLLAAIGRLSATHIGVTRQEYRPETHYRQVRDLWGGTRTPDGR